LEDAEDIDDFPKPREAITKDQPKIEGDEFDL
jgi:hypothetical protein